MEERFEKHREFLVDRIDPDFCLLDKLLASRTLKREAVHRIELKDNTTEDKNRILLDFILTNKKANDLVSALRDSGQTHLVNYLNADGGYDSAFGDDWPLSESDISRMEINRESLIDILDTTDLCMRLFSQNVINNRQKQLIFSKPTDSEKNKALLDILTKCSLQQYKMAIACLNDSNQSHIAELLSEGGVIVRVHANVEGTVGNVDEMEEEIITRLTEVLGNRPLEEHHRLWELTQQRIIAARKGHSIVIYIHCTIKDELLQLTDFLKTDELKGIIERVFIEMLSIGDVLRVSLTWSLEDFKRAATYFDSVHVCLSGELQSKLTVTERPSVSTALVEDSRHGGWLQESSNDASTQTDDESFIKKTKDRMPVDLEEDISRPTIILCSTETQTEHQIADEDSDVYAKKEDYFCMKRKLEQTQEENYRITKLLKHRALTDLMPIEFEEITSGSRILYGTKTQPELQFEDDDSNMMRAEMEKMAYISSVDSSAMSHIADDDSGVYDWSQKRRTFKKSEEIKPSRYDLGSSAYADKINRGKLRDIQEYVNSLGMPSRRQVFPEQLFVTQRQSIPEDRYPDLSAMSEDVSSLKWKLTETQKEKDKLNKLLEHHTDIAELPEKYKSDPILLQTIRTKAATEKQKSIRGFTFLGKELFVVSEKSSEVEVYDSMKFSFCRRWILKELNDPKDIVCCSINKCLYIFNLKVTGWPNKILRVDSNGEIIKTWSTGGDYGYGLSVTHETNVILTVTNKNKLYEYSPDGQLILEVNLSSDAGIHWPWHAVKLTNGNFVVSHGEDDDDSHTVCVVDADGKLKKSFCEKCRPIIGHMDYPMHLVVDGNGFVMVADRGNSRVLLLNPDLEFKREILSKEKHGLGNPTRIHLDETNGRLFVADRGRNCQQISIFSLDNYY